MGIEAIFQTTALEDEACYGIDSFSGLHIRKDKRAFSPHPQRIRFHDVETCAYKRSQIDLVDDEKIGARNTGSALARNLFAGRDIDHIDRQVRQLGAEGRRKVIAAGLDKAQLRMQGISAACPRWRRDSWRHPPESPYEDNRLSPRP